MCVVPSGKPLVGCHGCGRDRLLLCERDGEGPRQEGVRLGRGSPVVVVRPQGPPRGGGTTAREEKGSRPLSHSRHGCPIVRFRFLRTPGGCRGGAQAAPTPCGDQFGDHKAMMGSPIGGCRMGPSRRRKSGANVRGSPRSLAVKRGVHRGGSWVGRGLITALSQIRVRGFWTQIHVRGFCIKRRGALT